MSDDDSATEPNSDPPPDESPFEIQPLDVQERSREALRRETRDDD